MSRHNKIRPAQLIIQRCDYVGQNWGIVGCPKSFGNFRTNFLCLGYRIPKFLDQFLAHKFLLSCAVKDLKHPMFGAIHFDSWQYS
jgi:hypothetical protein